MNPLEMLRRGTTPLTAPVYPLRVTRFIDREYFNVVYRTDADALRAVVPEPLEIDEPLVRFEVMKMGEVDGYGPYVESGQAIPVTLDGERGEYLHAMYLDNFAATVSGRELSAYPKVTGTPDLRVDQGALVGTLDRGSERVATATMGYKWEPLDLDEAKAQITVPTFMVKLVPTSSPGHARGPPRAHRDHRHRREGGVDRTRPPAAVRARARTDGRPPVREIVSASHIVTDLTLAPVRRSSTTSTR